MQPILNARRIARFGALFGVMTLVTACSSALESPKDRHEKSTSQALSTSDESGVIRISTSVSAYPTTSVSWPSASTSTSTSTGGGGGGGGGGDPTVDAGVCGSHTLVGIHKRTIFYDPTQPFDPFTLCPGAKEAAADACINSADTLCYTKVRSDKLDEAGCGDVNTNPDGTLTRLCYCKWDVDCFGTYRAN